MFPPEFPASSKELERFAAATKAVSPVHHANLVTIVGAGRTGTHCWLARELVEGETAAAVVARVAGGGKSSWKQGLRMGVHLAHAHITPYNVLIRTADQVYKLTDLGVVKAFQGSQIYKSVREKKRLADLPYLAPEQNVIGAAQDEPEDLYSVGGVIYAFITGQPPFNGDSPQEILDNVQQGQLVNPSVYNKKIPADVEEVVLKLLALSPKDRYRTPAALLEDLKPLAASYNVEV